MELTRWLILSMLKGSHDAGSLDSQGCWEATDIHSLSPPMPGYAYFTTFAAAFGPRAERFSLS